jgi:ribosomal protein S14
VHTAPLNEVEVSSTRVKRRSRKKSRQSKKAAIAQKATAAPFLCLDSNFLSLVRYDLTFDRIVEQALVIQIIVIVTLDQAILAIQLHRKPDHRARTCNNCQRNGNNLSNIRSFVLSRIHLTTTPFILVEVYHIRAHSAHHLTLLV